MSLNEISAFTDILGNKMHKSMNIHKQFMRAGYLPNIYFIVI